MNSKLTLVKVGNEDYKPTPQDLEKWRDIFEKAKDDPAFMVQIKDDKNVSVEEIDLTEDPDYVTLVKVHTDTDWLPSKQDLQSWKEIFEEAQKDPDFVIFTHSGVSVERIKIGKDTKIIVGDAVVMSGN